VQRRGTQKSVCWLHRLATLVSAAAFALILTGALVTSRSGLAVPPWPALPVADDPPAPGGIEHQRVFWVVAALAGVLSLVLAVWAWADRREDRVKTLSALVILSFLALPLLGLAHFPSTLPAIQPIVYNSVAQLFFGLTICLAVFTRTNWNWDAPKSPETGRPWLRHLALFITAAAFGESLLGAAARSASVATHLVGGIALTMSALWAVEMVFDRYPEVPGLKAPAIILAEVVVLEVFIGIFVHSMKLDAPAGSREPAGLSVISTTHAAVGALALAASLYLTFQCFKHLGPAQLPIADCRLPIGKEAEG